MTTLDDAAVARRLEAAAVDAAWPAPPDLRAAVLARIATPDAPPAPDLRDGVLDRIRRRRAAGRRTLRPLLLGVLLLLALAGVAAGLGFRLPGVVIERVATTPPPGSSLDLGSPVPLADALGSAVPRVLVPAALPAPGTAWVLGSGDRRLVTLAWRAGPGEPTLPGSDLKLTVMAVPGSVDDELLHKLAGPDTRIDAIEVDGDRGWWLSGAPHQILVARPGGDIELLRPSLAGDTLLFVRDGTVYRLESALGKDATLDIARSMP